MRIINVFIISILLVGIWSSPLVQAQSFEDLVTVEYEQCTGDVTVEFIVWDDAAALGACVGDNQLDRLRITAVRPNNTEQLLGIYVWDNQNNDPTNYPAFICGSNLDFPTGGGANCRGYYFCSNAIGSFSSRFDGSNGYEYVKLRFRNMDDVFFGQTTKIKLVGSWDGRAVNQTFDDATQSDAPSVSNVQATTDTHCDKVRVTWDNPSLDCSASQYTAEIQRKLATDSNWPSPTIGTVNLAATNNTIFDDFTATKGLEYDYRVRVAFRPNFARTDVSNPTSTNSSGRRRGALPPPENIRASSGSCEDHIQVRWDWNQGTTNLGGFRIQRRPTSISTWTTIADNIDSGDREYQDLLNDASPVVPNVDYQYRVFSLNDCPVPDVSAVPSLTSNAIGNSPGAPSGPSAIMVVAETGVGANAINISWTHTAGATDEGFLLIRQGGGNTARIEIDDVNQRTYMDNDVQGCVNYTYTIKTKSECFPDGIGTQSASAILTPDLTQAFATDGTGLLASKGFFTDKVELTWTNSNQGQTSDHLIGRRLLGTSGAFANIASVGNTVELYNDETAEAGIFYEYEIVALDNCQGTPSNRVQAVGFRAQSGIVSGQVAYTGGFAVEGVKIIAETQSGQDPKSVLLNGSGAKLNIDTSASLRTMTNAAILETWVKLGSTAYSRSFDIFKKDGADSPFSLGYNLSTNRYEATVRDQSSRRIDLNFPISEIQIGQWIHVAMELENDTLYLYVDGNVVAQGHNNSFQELRNTAGKVQLGCNLAGHMKEVRFWRIAKDSTTFARDFSRFMSGQEEDLVMYLPLTEGVGDFGYDRSKDGQQFNRNHAEIVNGTWDQTPLPTTSQLGLASYTDDRGNYTILLPYRNAGELYRLIPFFPNHEFEPRNRDLFIGDGSPVINGVDFEDVSSFLTKGTLFFDGTNCPVSGANLKVDGQFVTDANGRLVETNNLGEWEIRVPIGDHFVEIEKRNHIMSEGRFPPTGTINFQEPRSNIRFMDTTLIKVVGRVVGGTREGDKDPALGKSKNNIGVAELMFEEIGGCLTYTVTTDSMTGEYIAYLPPLGYQPDVRVPSNPSLIPEFNKLEDPINLTMAFDTLSVSDTIPTPGPLDSVVTVEYNERLDYVIRFDPQIEVVDEFGLPFIGDTLYTYTHPATGETVTRNLRTDPFNWPVFTQGDVNKMYWVGILPYEQYVNLDKGAPGVIDSVPFNDGEIIINNELADAPYMEVKIKDVNPTDTLKTIWHQFLPGEPNTFPNTSIPQYSYTKKFEIGLRKNNGDIIPWNPVPLPQVPMGGDQIFRGYLLGGIVKEPGVITLGPEVPEYVLRDPPGSQSTAQRKVNTSKTDVRSWSWALKGATNVSDDLYVGADFTIGFGTATATEVFNNISVGYTTAVSGGRSGALKTTTTNSEAINTSGSGAFVGARGDVYLGYSQNLEIGTAEVLSIVPDTLSNIEFNDNTGIQNLNGFAFATRYTLSIEPDGYETRFVYSERFLESNVIPNLKRVRDLKLQTDPKYTNVTGNPGDPLYGADNDDPAWGAMASVCPNPDVTDCPAVLTGPSYTYNAVNNNDQDSVRWFNQQIRLWEDAIALNEWEKANIDDPDVIDSLHMQELAELDSAYSGDLAAFAALTAASAAGFITAAVANIVAVTLPVGGAIVGNVGFFVTTGTSIAKHEVSKRFLEYSARKDRINARFANVGKKNYSIDAGASVTASASQNTATSVRNKISYGVGTSLQQKIGGKINGTGVAFVRNIKLDYNSSNDWGSDSSTTETVTFTLKDPDLHNAQFVDVYQSLLGWGPIFKRVPGGQTSCPYEPADVSRYYAPGTVLSADTRRIDKPTIDISPGIGLTNIPADEPAVFNLTIGNATESDPGVARTYEIDLVGTSNPFGALVNFEGFPTTSVKVPAGTTINKVMTVEKGPGTVYDYDSLQIRIYAACQSTLFESDYAHAEFIPTCSDITLAVPEDQWVMNNSAKDTLALSAIDYNLNFAGFKRLQLDYKPADESQWRRIEQFWKDTTGFNDPTARMIDDQLPFTNYDWDIGAIRLPDGRYDLRAFTECLDQPDAVTVVSTTHRGIIDRVNPHAFGSPSPADGILDPGDDVLLRMNEPVDIGTISPLNFKVTGVVNGTELRHEASVAFDGINSFGTIPEYQLQQRSITVEFWLKRARTGAEMVLSQGASEADQLAISFNAANQIVFKVGNREITSNASITDNNWRHYTLIYDRQNLNAEILIAGQRDQTENTFRAEYNSAGPIEVGRHTSGAVRPFEGFIHELRLWSIARTQGQVALDYTVTLSGREGGLIGYWPMDEAYGQVADDKVRRRHMQLSGTTWAFDPENHAFMLDGNNDYLEATGAGSLSFGDDADITMEAWFKSGAGRHQTIFSNGLADGTRPETNAWSLGLSPAGAVIIENDGNSIASPDGLNDDNWHHVAVVVERTRAITMYIDGQQVATGNASLFKGFAGPKLWLGCRGWFAGTEQRDRFFDGSIDDVRIWNSARVPEQVSRDFVNQMRGDELGLKAYYPFDGIVVLAGSPERDPVLTDESSNDYDLTLGSSTTQAFTQNAPPVKLPRLTTGVDVTFSVNQDEIFIDINEPTERIENVTLDIEVDGLKDLAGNVMQEAETWIAFVDKNQVFWEEEFFQFEKDLADPLTFTTKLKNTGGSQERYSVTNIPSWLTVSPSGGVIDPNSEIEVSFTVEPLLNIGEYEQDIYVRTENFRFNERLLLDLKVTVDPPDWEVDESSFDASMNIIGQLEINGIISIDEDDLVSVWINDEIRGVSQVTLDETSGKYLIFLTVLGQAESTDRLEFRVWDASRGRLLVNVLPSTLDFALDQIIGSRSNPQIIAAEALTRLEYIVNDGWNWLSFPLASTSLNNVNTVFRDLSPAVEDLFRSVDPFTTYNPGGAWMGALTQLNTNEGYKLKITGQDTFYYEGRFNDPLNEPITVRPGWNWIGVKSEFIIDIESALASLDPQTGDLIKGQRSFAIYEDGFGWGGNLEFLIPQVGYMLKYHKADDLIFPSNLNALSKEPLLSQRKSNTDEERYYDVAGFVPGQYSTTMSLTAALGSCPILSTIDPTQWVLGAYAGGVCRGVAASTYVSANAAYVYYLSVEGSADEELQFRLVHKFDGRQITLSEGMDYQGDQVLGRTSEPYLFTCASLVDCVASRHYRSSDIISGSQMQIERAQIRLQSDAILPSTGSFRFMAGESVDLLHGFEVSSGALLEIIIQNCQNSQE